MGHRNQQSNVVEALVGELVFFEIGPLFGLFGRMCADVLFLFVYVCPRLGMIGRRLRFHVVLDYVLSAPQHCLSILSFL